MSALASRQRQPGDLLLPCRLVELMELDLAVQRARDQRVAVGERCKHGLAGFAEPALSTDGLRQLRDIGAAIGIRVDPRVAVGIPAQPHFPFGAEGEAHDHSAADGVSQSEQPCPGGATVRQVGRRQFKGCDGVRPGLFGVQEQHAVWVPSTSPWLLGVVLAGAGSAVIGADHMISSRAGKVSACPGRMAASSERANPSAKIPQRPRVNGRLIVLICIPPRAKPAPVP